MRKSKTIQFTFNNSQFEMTEREKLFCMHYVKNGFNASQACVDSGYSARTKREIGYEILTRPHVQSYVAALKEDIAFCLGIDAVDIAREYKKMGFSNIKKVFDEDGNMKPIHDIDDEDAAAIASVEVFEEFQGKGAERQFIGNTRRVKHHDKISALDKLAKMIGKDDVAKVANVDSKGKDLPPQEAPSIILLDPKSLTTEQLKAVIDAQK